MNGSEKILRIAIDGFSKCGKSTLAKKISEKYGFLYIDSGALYRLTSYILNRDKSISEKDMAFLDKVEMKNNGDIYFKGENYNNQIGLPKVNSLVSEIAKNPIVRVSINKWIYKKSREMSVVMDGRDIGTVVFPDADVKVYLYSSVEYRIEGWRKNQVKRVGYIDKKLEEQERENIIKRDYDDIHRDIAPLKQAADALVFNMEENSLEDVFQLICTLINKKLKC